MITRNFLEELAATETDEPSVTAIASDPATVRQPTTSLDPVVMEAIRATVLQIVPDVVELTLARHRVGGAITSPQPMAVANAFRSPSHPIVFDQAETDVPTIHQRLPQENNRQELGLVIGCLCVLVVGVGGIVSTLRSPSAQLDGTNQALQQSIAGQNQVIRDLAKEAAKSECRAICF